jgi:ubiquinone/menaquinone biosynthesis C-methylase UbiE
MIGSLVELAFGVLVCLGISYFFLITRGALIAHALVPTTPDKSHIYWAYSNKGLIRISDRKPCVAAVLLFQYDRIVDQVVREIKRGLNPSNTFLMTACAFGDVMPRVVRAAVERGAGNIAIADLLRNQLDHAAKKLDPFNGKLELLEADATNMPQPDGSVDMNLIFFLLHELPDSSKENTLQEAMRLAAPGGKLIIAEFHRPRSKIFRLLGWLYFTTFEPYALSMWGHYDLVGYFSRRQGWTVEHSTYFFGNFQVVVATNNA